MSRVVRELLNENTHCTTSLTATVKPLITALNTPSLCPCGAGWPMSSSQRSKRQLQANGSANRLAADGSSTARFGSGLVSLGGAPKVRLRFHGHTARHCTPLTAALPHEHLHRVKQQPVNSQHPPPSTCHRYERCVCSTPPVCNKLRTGTRWQRSTSRRPRLEQQDRATPRALHQLALGVWGQETRGAARRRARFQRRVPLPRSSRPQPQQWHPPGRRPVQRTIPLLGGRRTRWAITSTVRCGGVG